MIFRTTLLAGLASIALSASAQEPQPPDCSRLSASECHQQSMAWSAQLAAARNAGDGWTVGCNKDRVTLATSCFATKFFGPGASRLRVQHDERLGYCFSAAMNNHPGRSAVIRIGSNAAVQYERTMVCGRQAQELIQQLLTSADGAARGYVWPNKTDEFEFTTVGFEHAWKTLQARVNATSPASASSATPN